jgi:AcrR family transcriptional regulator
VICLEKFFSLPAEKQTTIIDAALTVFGTNGYKKTSVSDIAAAAGISKAMVFHYFGTKKELYLYLFQYCSDLITKEINERFDSSITDFFDRIMNASEIKLSVINKHPATISFLTSVYFERHAEVKDDIAAALNQGNIFRNKIAFDGMDTSKFKDGVDPKLVMKILLWMAEGFVNTSKELTGGTLDDLMKQYYECMNLLRLNFYKEEFLKKN